ncbi:MAG: c-type cytochrome [Nitrospirae bacterium]|nr:c-type cytochrome [Nitrospirota bacterium]
MASSSRLKPGETGKVSLSVDPAGKKGPISKTAQVVSNDPVRPVITLTVTMNVKDDLHMGQLNAGQIFKEGCGSCHVEQGRGKKGFDLFRADCFMCHNAGRSSSITQMSRKPERELFKAIRDGVENSMMPGWALEKGGPLNDSEIESLVRIIRDPN